jgi:glycerophosphoryl diester phosphodiesterase
MGLTTDGLTLLPLLEKPLVGDPDGQLLIHEFDLEPEAYNGIWYFYPLDPQATAIGDFIMFEPTRGLVIERDDSQGDLGAYKAIYKVRLGAPETLVRKRLAVDLLRILDPARISLPGLAGDVGLGRNFAFPFITIEDVVVFDNHTIGVMNDNNYPFTIGRHLGAGLPDDSEFLISELDRPLSARWGSNPDACVPTATQRYNAARQGAHRN